MPAAKIGRTVKTRGRLRGKDGSTREHVPNQPGKTVTASRTGRERVLLEHARHPMSRPDEPSYTVTTKGDGRGAQGACVVEWPWDRPSTTVTTRAGIPPPGHHPESGSILSQPNAVVLSELAAAILQGFPEGWVFAGKTKISRWSQIGQAMPPALAAAVARSVREQMVRAKGEEFCVDRSTQWK